MTSNLQSDPRLSSGFLATVLLLTLISPPLLAVDGVIEINQVKALAGGVSLNDTPGFPVVLEEPGSYRLTGNLTVDDVNTTAIQVDAENVTLDLNGFSLLGPMSCTYSGGTVLCSEIIGPGMGIRLNAGNFAAHSGVIRGFGQTGVIGGPVDTVQLRNLRILENGLAAILLQQSANASIINCHIVRNGLRGLEVGSSVRLTGSMVVQNGNAGVVINGPNGIVSNNIITENTGDGLRFNGANTGGTVLNNRIADNNSRAIAGNGADIAYGENFIRSTGGTVPAAAIQIGINVCNGNTTCP